MELERLIKIARGDEDAEFLLTGGQLVNVFSGEIYPTDIAIAGGRIAGLGNGYKGRETLDLGGRYVCPGFIDAHVHLESAMVRPSEFARAVIPHGVTTAISDPHEIANVLGLDGIRFMLRESEQLPLSVFVNASSCVPATAMETSGARLEADDLVELLEEPRVLGLAEVMDFPGVIAGAESVLAKIRAFGGRVIDGHGPGLEGQQLNAYVAAGIATDHECTSGEELLEKMRLGVAILIREASAAHNLRTLIRLVRPENERRLCFCTDDRNPRDLLHEGSIDRLIRLAIAEGVEPLTAIRMATLNAAEVYRLHDRGAIAPGRRADLVVFRSLSEPRPEQVYVHGTRVFPGEPPGFERGEESLRPLAELKNTVAVDCSGIDLGIPARGDRVRAIDVVPGQLVTGSKVLRPAVEKGQAVADPERDLLKMAVIERHRGSGHVGLGFVTGMGLRRGAIAGTVAHDHHNLVVIGADDRSMLTAISAIAGAGGGLAVTHGTEVVALLPLPIAGLMSAQRIETVGEQYERVIRAARELGSTLRDPLMRMSFLTLEVIPELKLTDLGLVDVERFELVNVFVES